jgi:outer membrane receptor for ferrienterochelin and colicin
LRYTTGPVRDTLPGYTTLELGGTVLAWRAAAIVVRIQNLFDARYGDGTATGQQLRGGYLAPGRRAIVGLRLELR